VEAIARTCGQTLRAAAIAAVACGRSPEAEGDAAQVSVVSAPSATAPGAPRPGMVWIPAGVLRAGSAPEDVPRVADAELPGVDVAMGGFYMDALPWPNEVGAIPTTNVTRDEAQRLCATRGKRLCTELEWERGCKGPDNARYEYGPTYDARVCGAGVSAEASMRRPAGERTACQSAFGVREMHGGAWEWTDSSWGRNGAKSRGVTRGGNDELGELASRCAFARPLAPAERAATVGFRCCAGPRNEAQVQMETTSGPIFERTPHPPGPSPPLDALGAAACGPPASPSPCWIARAWTWRPTANVELALSGGCMGRGAQVRCALAIARTIGDKTETLAQVDTDREIPEVVLVEGPERRIRVRGLDVHGHFFRDVVFTYGRVDVRPAR
jgi:formylglycine-generating enzyme required for sulfatase activity